MHSHSLKKKKLLQMALRFWNVQTCWPVNNQQWFITVSRWFNSTQASCSCEMTAKLEPTPSMFYTEGLTLNVLVFRCSKFLQSHNFHVFFDIIFLKKKKCLIVFDFFFWYFFWRRLSSSLFSKPHWENHLTVKIFGKKVLLLNKMW